MTHKSGMLLTEPEQEEEICPECNGTGTREITRSEHDPRCDGSCSVGCPVPVPDLVECRTCAGGRR